MEEYSSERYSGKIFREENRERKDSKISDIMRYNAAIFLLPFIMHYFIFLIASLIISIEG